MLRAAGAVDLDAGLALLLRAGRGLHHVGEVTRLGQPLDLFRAVIEATAAFCLTSMTGDSAVTVTLSVSVATDEREIDLQTADQSPGAHPLTFAAVNPCSVAVIS